MEKNKTVSLSFHPSACPLVSVLQSVFVRAAFSNLCTYVPVCFQVSQDGKALLDVLQRPLSPGNSESLTATANYSKAVSGIAFLSGVSRFLLRANYDEYLQNEIQNVTVNI